MGFALSVPILATLGAVAVVIAADVLVAIIIAIAKQEFNVRILPAFLVSDGVPFVLLCILGGAAMLQFKVEGVPEAVASLPFAGLFWAGAVAQIAKQTAEIKDKLTDYLGEVKT